MTVVARAHLFVAAAAVEPGDMVALEKTSGGVTLTAQRTLVLDVRQYDAGPADAGPTTWLHLDHTGVPMGTMNRPRLGTFLNPETIVEVWR